jgi:hypothetical protein
MNCGHALEVNSAGTRCSAFAIIGAAASLTGISNSERGNSGSVCCSSIAAAVFLALVQEKSKVITRRQGMYFNGYFIIIITNEYKIPHGKLEVFHNLFYSLIAGE